MIYEFSDNLNCNEKYGEKIYLFYVRRSEIIQGLRQLPDLIRKVLDLDGKVLTIAKELYKKRSLLIMGRGFNFATCLEGALKVGFGILKIHCIALDCVMV